MPSSYVSSSPSRSSRAKFRYRSSLAHFQLFIPNCWNSSEWNNNHYLGAAPRAAARAWTRMNDERPLLSTPQRRLPIPHPIDHSNSWLLRIFTPPWRSLEFWPTRPYWRGKFRVNLFLWTDEVADTSELPTMSWETTPDKYISQRRTARVGMRDAKFLVATNLYQPPNKSWAFSLVLPSSVVEIWICIKTVFCWGYAFGFSIWPFRFSLCLDDHMIDWKILFWKSLHYSSQVSSVPSILPTSDLLLVVDTFLFALM